MSIAFSADGRLLAGASTNIIRVWDVQALAQTRLPLGSPYGGDITDIAFGPDDQTLLTSGYDAVESYDVNGSPLASPLAQSPEIDGAFGVWATLSLSADRRIVASSGGGDHNARLLDAVTLQPVGDPLPGQGPFGNVESVSLSPDASLVAVTSMES